MMSDFGAALKEVAVPFIPFYNLLKFAAHADVTGTNLHNNYGKSVTRW